MKRISSCLKLCLDLIMLKGLSLESGLHDFGARPLNARVRSLRSRYFARSTVSLFPPTTQLYRADHIYGPRLICLLQSYD